MLSLSTTSQPATLAIAYKDQNGAVMAAQPGAAATFDDTVIGITFAEDDSSVTVTPLKAGTTDLIVAVGAVSSAPLSVVVSESSVLTSIVLEDPSPAAPAAEQS